MPRFQQSRSARSYGIALVALFAPWGLYAQDAGGVIQDNSFIIEEAYNQEAHVVQHISTFVRDGSSFAYQFVQEWPLGGVKHQLSYTVAILRPDAVAGVGFGDVKLNYRLQLVGDGEAKVAASPRLTAVLPTGDYQRGRGAGGPGVELFLPVSVVLSRNFVGHGNVGFAVTPRARAAGGARAAAWSWAAGGSVIWLARSTINFLLEGFYQRTAEVVGPGQTVMHSAPVISPGVRWALNFRSGLQVVPGLAVPIGVGPSSGERSLFIYLSLEHPFNRKGSHTNSK